MNIMANRQHRPGNGSSASEPSDTPACSRAAEPADGSGSAPAPQTSVHLDSVQPGAVGSGQAPHQAERSQQLQLDSAIDAAMSVASAGQGPSNLELYGPGASEPIRVLLADDHVVVRAGICSLLEALDGVEVVAQASNGHEALRLLEDRALRATFARPATDIAILDISMGGMNGLEAAAHIARLHPETRVIMLSMHDSEEYVKQALRAGAVGYLLKESGFNELELAVRTVARGEVYLSPTVSRHLVAAYVNRSGARSTGTSALLASTEIGKPPGRRLSDSGSDLEAVVLTPRQQEILRLLAQGLSNGQIASRLSISIKTVETHRAGLMSRLNIFDIVGLVRYAVRHGFIEPL